VIRRFRRFLTEVPEETRFVLQDGTLATLESLTADIDRVIGYFNARTSTRPRRLSIGERSSCSTARHSRRSSASHPDPLVRCRARSGRVQVLDRAAARDPGRQSNAVK
jgi:hypothetical protein